MRILLSIIVCLLSVNAVAKPSSLVKLKPPTPKETDFRDAAADELTLPNTAQTPQVLSTPATVRPRVEAIESPVTYTAVQIGFSLSTYRPEGRTKVSNLQPYDLSSLGESPLPSLEIRWQPYQISNLYLGGFTSLGYSLHDVQLRAPTGQLLPSTKLHTMKGAGGLATTYRFGAGSRWSVAGLFGVGYLNSVQASKSTFANTSTGLPFATGQALMQVRFFEKWTGYAGYEMLNPLRDERGELKLPRGSAMVGLLGSLR